MNPVAKLITAAVIALALVLSVDWVSALTALVLEIPLFLVLGVRLRPLVVRGGLVAVAAALTALTNLLYGEVRGTVYWHFLLINVSEGSVQLALAMFLRVLAIALPSVLLFADVQATELADGLGQVLRLPARFVVGALAGMRLVGLLHQDWQYLGYARRARGVADHGGYAGFWARPSRCWCSRSAGAPSLRPPWKPAGSVPTRTAPGRGRRRSACGNSCSLPLGSPSQALP